VSSSPSPGTNGAVSFEQVLYEELDQIAARRARHQLAQEAEPRTGSAPAMDVLLAQARQQRLVGLALSGGGIRSATFNLGLLQGLANQGLLRLIDYVSAVSGGGYIGGWLAACVARGGGLKKFEKQLQTGTPPRPNPAEGATVGARRADHAPARAGDREPPALLHLRTYSNYLTPRRGFLSADTWVLWASYLRNFLLNQMVLLPLLLAVLMVPRALMFVYHVERPNAVISHELFWPVLAGIAVCGFLALWLIFTGLGNVNPRKSAVEQTPQPEPCAPGGKGRQVWIVVLFVVAAAAFCFLTPYRFYEPPDDQTPAAQVQTKLGFELAEDMETDVSQPVMAKPVSPRVQVQPSVAEAACFMSFFGAIVLLACLTAGWHLRALRPAYRWYFSRELIGTVLGAVAGGAALYGIYLLLNALYESDSFVERDYVLARATARVVTFGPPLVLVAVVVGSFIGVGLLGGNMREELREWWSSLCGRLLLAAGLWTSVNLVALYATPLVLWADPWLKALLGSTWLVTTATGVLAGKGSGTGGTRTRNPWLDGLARLAPHVFVAGLLIAVSLLLHAVFDDSPNWSAATETTWYRDRVPTLPPFQVTATTTSVPGQAGATTTDQQTVARQEVASEGEIQVEMYWLGMLNSEKGIVPQETYHINNEVALAMLRAGVPQATLRSLLRYNRRLGKLVALQSKDMDREHFEEFLRAHLPADTSYVVRTLVIQYAKEVKSINYQRLKLLTPCFWLAYILWALMACLGSRVDVNLFSLHSVYGNRLTRCYLGASRAERHPDPTTEFDPDDDLPLSGLRLGPHQCTYDGPFLIVNTALNLVHTNRRDWQERQAAAFVLTPLYCGSELTDYRKTLVPPPASETPATHHAPPTTPGYGNNISLGTTLTLSGAAASPNMGYHSSPPVTALLTVFNARLGAWLGNPRKDLWNRAGPGPAPGHLLKELFGLTDENSDFVYLSDGGHFENLGVYELVRRRCQYIIAADASCDPGHDFEDFANLVRKVRVDFDIRIEIDFGPLRLQEGKPGCRWHCAVGKVHYEDADDGAMPGTLIYLKPSLTGDEPADVQHYAESHARFPHESTADQFYNESQFESYRALGQHVAEEVFEQSRYDMEQRLGGPLFRAPAATPPDGERHREACRELFASIERRWFALPPEYESTFLQTTRGYVDVQEAFRKDHRLWRLTLDLYPELDPDGSQASAHARETPAERVERRCAEIHVIAQMLQVMESAWLSLNLDVQYAHPLNRGWLDVFHRWINAPTVRHHWPVLRSEVARGFASFCEKQMQLGPVLGVARWLTPGRPYDQRLRRQLWRLNLEFRDQWPNEMDLFRRTRKALGKRGVRGWLVYAHNSYPADADAPADEQLPCGVLFVSLPRPRERLDGMPVYDFFVWMRGPYRNTGLGRPAVQQALAELQRRCRRRPFCLRVRLRVDDFTGPGGKLQKAMWLTFFAHHEFEELSSPTTRDTILVRRFPVAAPAVAPAPSPAPPA
jgi:hypothetical protein